MTKTQEKDDDDNDDDDDDGHAPYTAGSTGRRVTVNADTNTTITTTTTTTNATTGSSSSSSSSTGVAIETVVRVWAALYRGHRVVPRKLVVGLLLLLILRLVVVVCFNDHIHDADKATAGGQAQSSLSTL